MLKSYEAIYENGRIKWINEQPPAVTAHIIVTVLDDDLPVPKKRCPSASIFGKGKILGDIVNPIVDEGDWECLK
jgi:hypothetical protein